MKIQSVGTIADKSANVDISKVYGGYFGDTKNIDIFIKIGIESIEKNLPKKLNYVDFGGGQGQLANGVKKYLESKGFEVHEIVADSNEDYLELAKNNGLNIQLYNLEGCYLPNTDLLTMRAVLHYNTSENQNKILKDVYNSLNNGGYFVLQDSSGSKENCDLRSELVNIIELGRAGAGSYHWITLGEYEDMLKQAGFVHISRAGYAPSNTWGPESQWERFNGDMTKKVKQSGDNKLSIELEERKNTYLDKAYKIIEEYRTKYGDEHLGLKRSDDGKIVIEYLYPIVVVRK